MGLHPHSSEGFSYSCAFSLSMESLLLQASILVVFRILFFRKITISPSNLKTTIKQ